MHYFPVMLLRLLQVWAELLDHTVAICVEEICEPCGATGLTQCVHRMHSHPLIPQAHATLGGWCICKFTNLGPAHLPARLLNMKQPACGISLSVICIACSWSDAKWESQTAFVQTIYLNVDSATCHSVQKTHLIQLELHLIGPDRDDKRIYKNVSSSSHLLFAWSCSIKWLSLLNSVHKKKKWCG